MFTAEQMRDAWAAIVAAQDPEPNFYVVANPVRDIPSEGTGAQVRWRIHTSDLVKDIDGRFVTKSNIVMSVFVFTPTDRTADEVVEDHSSALDIARAVIMDFDATYANDTYNLRFDSATFTPLIEMGTDNRTGVFVQVEVMDLSGECGEEVEVGTCSGVDILDQDGNVIAHINDGDTYTITPMILPYANDAAASAITIVPTTAQVVHIVATGRFYPGNGTSTVAQLVSAKTFLPSVTMNNGLTTVVEGDTVNIQLYQ